MKTIIKEGDKLYYADNGALFGTVKKVLKRDVRVERTDGTIENRPISMAVKMIIK